MTFDRLTRRSFLRGSLGLGAAAMASAPGRAHHAPRAKHAILLTMAGAPSQLDLLDPKPQLARWRGSLLPDSVRMGQRVTTMTAGQPQKIQPALFPFRRYGACGTEISELLPAIGRLADRICLIRSMHTEEINHAPAMTLLQTGHPIPGRPSLGAWLAYGLGSPAQDLPAFVVMICRDVQRTCDQPVYDQLWSAGFLPSRLQGVKVRAASDPVPYLSDPPGVDRTVRRGQLDTLAELNRLHHTMVGDPEIEARIAQYELAFRMQVAVPDVLDLTKEPASSLRLYGPNVHRPGTLAWSCLLARRLVERGVRCVQIYHVGWDQHRHLREQLRVQCAHADQPSAGLVADLEQRGLLDDTLVAWGGEFGRGVAAQGDLDAADSGRDHHPRCFSIWLAGGGVKAGHVHGETCEFGFNIVRDPVHVHDLQATILHCLGLDHERLTASYQGRDFRLTDVGGRVVRGLLS